MTDAEEPMTARDYIACLKRQEIPAAPPDGLVPDSWSDWRNLNWKVISSLEYSRLRQQITRMGLWTVLADGWVRQLADRIGSRRVLEIMAGRGWLAKALKAHGVKITVTDNKSWGHVDMPDVIPVQRMDAVAAVRHYGPKHDILLVSWPHGDSPICDAAAVWGPNKPIIYIGEGDGGACAPEEFFERFEIDETGGEILLPVWYGMHDRIRFGRYLTSVGRE